MIKHKKIVWIHELSIAFEDNFRTALEYKTNKYNTLIEDIKSNGYQCFNEPIMVGSRGMIPWESKNILRNILKITKSPFPKPKLIKLTSKASLLGSYAIYLSRNDPIWTEQEPISALY